MPVAVARSPALLPLRASSARISAAMRSRPGVVEGKQVAAYADRHVVVEKSHDGTVTSSGLTVLDDDQRERELSRMLAGLTDSDTALAHARELLEVAQPARALG